MTTNRKKFNERQQAIISSILNEFHFSSNPTQLRQQINTLKAALEENADKYNPFYYLGQCLLHPQNFLQELALTQGEAGTVEDVKRYLIKKVGKKISRAAKKSHSILSELGWDFNDILEKCLIKKEILVNSQTQEKKIIDDKKDLFVRGQAELRAWENPWQPPELNGWIYTRTTRENISYIETPFEEDTINIDEEEEIPSIAIREILLDVSVDIQDDLLEETFFLQESPTFNDDDEGKRAEHAFIEKIIEQAEEKSLTFAAETVLEIIKASEETKNKALKQSATKKIITHQYYFTLLREEKCKLNYFLNSTEQQAINFTDEKLIHLLNNQLCDFSYLKLLKTQQYKVATHHLYYKMLGDGSLLMRNLLTFSDNFCQFLLHPYVTRLIQTGKLKISEALLIPSPFFKLYTNRLYQTYFNENPQVAQIAKLKPNLAELMLIPEWAELITSNKIELSMLENMPELTLGLLQMYKYLTTWIKHDIVTFQEVLDGCESPQKFYELFINAFVRRVCAIFFNNDPFVFKNKPDSYEMILAEINALAKDCGVGSSELHKWVIYYFLHELQRHLIDKPKEKIYNKILDVIDFKKSDANNWQEVLAEIIELAEKHNEKQNKKRFSNYKFSLTTSFTQLFEPPPTKKTKSNHSESNHLCSQLIAMKPIDKRFTHTREYK